jgi:hypothetical protein
MGNENMLREGETHDLLVDAKDGLPSAELVVRSHDTPLTTADMRSKRGVIGQLVAASPKK